MGTDLRERSLSAQRLFELADVLSGQPISRLCAEGPLDRLTQTEIAQPAVVVTSLAALAVLREHMELAPAAVAGHSVGEFPAYVAAGVLDPEAALRLVQARLDPKLMRREPEYSFKLANEVKWRDTGFSRNVLDRERLLRYLL